MGQEQPGLLQGDFATSHKGSRRCWISIGKGQFEFLLDYAEMWASWMENSAISCCLIRERLYLSV